jgi:hypothetical protein
MYSDPIIEELHGHRKDLMKRFNYDFEAFFAFLKEQEEKSEQPVTEPRPRESQQVTSPQRARSS